MAAPPQIMAADFQASVLTNSFWLRKEITNVGLFAPFINTTGGVRLKSDGLAWSPFGRASHSDGLRSDRFGVGGDGRGRRVFFDGHSLVRNSGGGPRFWFGDAGASERGRDFSLLAHFLSGGRSGAT